MAPRLPDDLLRPAAYGDRRPAEVDLVETHISWVFLLERDVFKVKKPVELGFLDFRTLDARRGACEAEARLNQRLAPGVYHGVVPVRRGPDGRACLGDAGGGADGPVVDWAVHMTRLPDDERADVRLARGLLRGEDVDAIAEVLARFHEASPPTPETARFGDPALVATNVNENFAQTTAARSRYLAHEEADEIVRWQTAFLNEHRATLEARARAGRVRDGHGDLRLEHVYLRAGGITVLDCIEFNERFRIADVAADVAFLSMDLAASGRVDLAERLLARYARASNDFDLYDVVDFYESYRAFVRAKIASFRADDPSLPESARGAAGQEARRYFLLALSADRRSLLSPLVVGVGGIIASGKSTMADHLASELSAPVVDADRTRKSLLGVEAKTAVHDAAWSGAYDPAFTERVYAEVLRRADVVLASGRPVVVEASFRSPAMRGALRALAAKRGVPFRFVECRAPLDVCRARLEEREKHESVSDGRLAIFDAFCARYEPPTEIDPAELVVLDTTRAWSDSLGVLRDRLPTWPPGLVR